LAVAGSNCGIVSNYPAKHHPAFESIFAEDELSAMATCKDYLKVRLEGKRDVQRQIRHYNLDAIIAIVSRFIAESDQLIPFKIVLHPD
jgi:hypothetical protein